jgi:hypothetical protein
MNIENQFFAPFAKTFAPFALKKKRLFGQLHRVLVQVTACKAGLLSLKSCLAGKYGYLGYLPQAALRLHAVMKIMTFGLFSFRKSLLRHLQLLTDLIRGVDTVSVLHFVCTGLFKYNAFGVRINRIFWFFGHPRFLYFSLHAKKKKNADKRA